MNSRLASIILLLTFITGSFYSQNTFLGNNLQVFSIGVHDGLSQSSVKCIIQDRKGYLWFGTANGLNRYDGYNFLVFTNDPRDSNTISDNGILSLYEDRIGNLWIGTSGGTLNKYDRKRGVFSRVNLNKQLKSLFDFIENYYDLPLPFSRNSDNSITAITEDKLGNLWIGTWGRGLIKYNPTTGMVKQISVDRHRNPSSNRIQSVLIDNDENIWVGSIGGGLFKVVEKNERVDIQSYNLDNNNSTKNESRIISLCQDYSGNLWIGTYGEGLFKLDQKDFNKKLNEVKFKKYLKGSGRNSLPGNFVMSISNDPSGNLWIGTSEGGISLFNPNTNMFQDVVRDPVEKDSLVKNDILTTFVDHSGIVWIGTNLGKGINKIEPNTSKFTTINRSTGLNDDIVWSIYEDRNSILWIGTYKGGLNRLDRKKNNITSYKNNPEDSTSISDNHIRAIIGDKNGNLWIGTYHGGLNRLNIKNNSFTHFEHNQNENSSLSSNQVQTLFIDSRNNYWVGTFGGGLCLFDGEQSEAAEIKFKRFINDPKNPFSLSDNRVYNIHEGREGIIWIGTYGGGLNAFDYNSGKFISYKNNPDDETSISDNRIMSIHEDKEGFLWIATYGGGLNKFDRKLNKFTRFHKKNNLHSSVVYGILEDEIDQLWLSTDQGIYKFNKANQQFTQYELNDGVQNLEFSGGAFFKSVKGEMFFGGINGLNHFFPDKVIDNTNVPPIVISSISIFNETIKGEPDTLILNYDQNFFSFEFASLDYLNPRDNKYAYMLQGVDKEWNFVDSRRRRANYTNLSPGDYIFVVIGSNNDGIWNYEGSLLYIKILPPFYKRWWFILPLVLLILTISYYIISLRFRSLLIIEKLKSRLAADLHDNIGSGLTEISILSEIASNQLKNHSEVTLKNLNSISEKARLLIDNMSDIVWIVNPKRDSFYHLILRLKDSYSDLLHATGISFRSANLENLEDLKLPHDYKQNLFLILKEGINNAIKHSSCKKIILSADLQNNKLFISLKDDGEGIDNSRFESGNGILNMKSRAKLLHGELKINSSDQGTEIIFECDIKKFKKPLFPRNL
jgi:ligand-binding sensor domain-containing protein/anti-sigma regulatory factor (Ser/Thr protein kinase)